MTDRRTASDLDAPTPAHLALPWAARRMGISPHTLRAWACYQHRLPFYRVGRRIVFAVADLDAFLAANRVPARGEGAR